jgi:hypothetical protein
MGFEMVVDTEMTFEGDREGRLDQGMGQEVEALILVLGEVLEVCPLHHHRRVGDIQRNIMEEISHPHLPCHCTMEVVEVLMVLMVILDREGGWQ